MNTYKVIRTIFDLTTDKKNGYWVRVTYYPMPNINLAFMTETHGNFFRPDFQGMQYFVPVNR